MYFRCCSQPTTFQLGHTLNKMIEIEKINSQVEKVLANPTVGKAQRMLQSKSGVWFIAIISFVESALPVPILTDPFLVAGILLNRAKAVQITLLTIVSSVLGGVVAYFSAVLFLETMLSVLPSSMEAQFQEMVSGTNVNTFVLTILGAVTPIPYTMAAWAVAVLQGSLVVFIIGSIIGRSARYIIIGYCAYRFGPTAMVYARKYTGLVSIILILLGIVFLIYKM